MKIYVYIDPEYNGSVWCSQTLKGLTNEATKRHYGVYILENENILACDFDKIYADEQRRVLIILTTHIITDSRFYEHFSKNGVSLLFVNHQSSFTADNYSNILVDYRAGMAQLMKYLKGCKKEKTALFAINPASSTDQIKKDYFLSLENGESNIYYNNGSLEECCEKFYKSNKYDSVICANDVAAYCLINFLKRKGIRVPEDIYIASFGDSLLSQMGSPSLTTVSVDHIKIGKEALHAYSYLYRRSEGIRTSVYVTPKLNIRQSTEKLLVDYKEEKSVYAENPDPMYCDEAAQKILRIEKLLDSCDENDLEILRGILRGKTYSKISEELYMSEKTVSYRVTGMRNILGCATKEELAQCVGEYVDFKL